MHFIETHTNHEYTGVDVAPRLPGIVQATAQGLIPKELVEQAADSYAYVVSTNVFQHLSSKQRLHYYEDIRRLLVPGGLFNFNLCIDTGKVDYLRDAAGNAWCDHYGQFTEVPKANIYTDLAAHFGVLCVTQRYDGVFNFVCQRRTLISVVRLPTRGHELLRRANAPVRSISGFLARQSTSESAGRLRSPTGELRKSFGGLPSLLPNSKSAFAGFLARQRTEKFCLAFKKGETRSRWRERKAS
ncbi:MAG TPA: class I SAM-dependent methyltransferase [Polyangiaceae bacterium]|nr:class I SAM-dependent methyltransferase [Polyangiaceae bacterium]